VTEALEFQARLPVRQPTLPDQASDLARELNATSTSDQKDAAERTATRAAETAHGNSANAAARKAAAAAAELAVKKSKAAVDEIRADEVRQGKKPAKPDRKKKKPL
jgi:hypothetical protein